MQRLIRNSVGALNYSALLLLVLNPANAQTTVSDDHAPSPGAPELQTSGGPQLEEVTVTAERRESSLQSTPIAIAAITGDTLRAQQINTFESLATTVPDLTFSRDGGDARIFIRGIGVDAVAPGQDPRVAVYADGVYNARVQAALNTLYDVDRIEVLSGPQGTLYGRNSTAGAINIISRDPGSELNGYATLTAGNYGLVRTEGAVGGPLSSLFSARVAFQSSDHNGYGTNLTNGTGVDDEHTRAVRGKLQFTPTAAIRVLLEADYFSQDDATGGYHFFGNTPGNELTSESLGFLVPGNPRDTYGSGPHTKLNNYGASLTTNIDLGGPVLTSISAFRHLDSLTESNLDGSSSNYTVDYVAEKSDEYTQELRLTDTIGPVDILGGAYYFNETNFAGNDDGLNGANFGLPPQEYRGFEDGGTQVTQAYALFTQDTIHLTDSLGVDLGVRYSSERKRMDQFSLFDLTTPYSLTTPLFAITPGTARLDQAAKWSSTDPRVTIHYQLTPTIYTYATYARGFKSGGFNFSSFQPPFAPEKITDYEVGIKADLFERRLRVNLSAFKYDYTNLQVNIAAALAVITTNAAASNLKGAEMDLSYLPTRNLRLNLNFAYLDSQYTQYTTADPSRLQLGPLNLAGNELSYAPKVKADAGAAYTFHEGYGDLTPRASVAWVDRTYFSQFNLPYVNEGGHYTADLFLDYESPDDRWSAAAFVKNATDHFYKISETVGVFFLGYPLVGQVAPPRTFGVSLTRRF